MKKNSFLFAPLILCKLSVHIANRRMKRGSNGERTNYSSFKCKISCVFEKNGCDDSQRQNLSPLLFTDLTNIDRRSVYIHVEYANLHYWCDSFEMTWHGAKTRSIHWIDINNRRNRNIATLTMLRISSDCLQ